MVLKGDIENTVVNRDSLFQQYKLDPASVDLRSDKGRFLLRAEVALEDKYNLFERTIDKKNLVLFTPVTDQYLWGLTPMKSIMQ